MKNKFEYIYVRAVNSVYINIYISLVENTVPKNKSFEEQQNTQKFKSHFTY